LPDICQVHSNLMWLRRARDSTSPRQAQSLRLCYHQIWRRVCVCCLTDGQFTQRIAATVITETPEAGYKRNTRRKLLTSCQWIASSTRIMVKRTQPAQNLEWLLGHSVYGPPVSTSQISALCPQSKFIGFVWLPWQTVILFINWLCDLVATDTEVPGSIPGATTFSEK
jgi:hypothetical protein